MTPSATSAADPSRFATATLTVNASPVTVSISPTSVTLVGGGNAQFTATVGGASNTAVTWTVAPSSAGTVTSSGFFTAANVTVLTTANVNATSVADPSKGATASLSIQPNSPVTLVSLSPSYGLVQTETFSLVGRSSASPISLYLGVGSMSADPNINCSFYYSTGIGGLAWTGTSPASGVSWMGNSYCHVQLNSASYNPTTTNWTVNVSITRFEEGYQGLNARVSSPSGDTGWSLQGVWNFYLN